MDVRSLFGGTVSLPEWTPTWRVEPVETDRDELLRQIGERLVERVDENGVLETSDGQRICPTCEEWTYYGAVDHADWCELTRYLEATDE